MKYSYNYNKLSLVLLINYLLVGYAFCLPISKAGVNFFEILILIFWIFQGDWQYKFERYRQNKLILLLSIFLIYSFVSVLWASSISYGLDYIAKYRHFLIIFVAYISLERSFIKHIFSAFLSGMFISEIMSYSIFFELITYKNILPSDPSPFMSHTDYSIYLAFTSIILLFRVITKNETLKYRVIYTFFFLSVTANLFINGGRTGQVTLIVIIIITFFVSIKSKIKGFLISVLLIISIFTLSYNTSLNFNNRINQAKIDIENMIYHNNYKGSFATRVSLWIIGVNQLSTNNILFGMGIGNEMTKIQSNAESIGFSSKHLSNFSDHHNTFITILLQSGILGLFLILWMFYSILSLKFISTKYKVYNLTFIVSFTLWSFGGHTMHLMNSMIFFTLFTSIFNRLSYLESKELK